ncbi:MAG: DUF1016 N-terminal domain-containing protein [Candidatus Cloacimonadales bacterium]|nr:DUF1016 N-terminal domain-containing protein [Candidatus Cloacimonadales bacterium]
MKLKFDSKLAFQLEAIESITDIFEGQEICKANFSVTKPTLSKDQLTTLDAVEGVGNKLNLLPDELQENVLKIQLRNGLKQAAKSINTALTLRNWIIGGYIYEYEQKGEDRAEYGAELLMTLADQLKELNIKGLSYTNLNLFRQLYLTYPQILQALPEEFKTYSNFIDASSEIQTDYQILQAPEESGEITVELFTKSSAEMKNLPTYTLAGNNPLLRGVDSEGRRGV